MGKVADRGLTGVGAHFSLNAKYFVLNLPALLKLEIDCAANSGHKGAVGPNISSTGFRMFRIFQRRSRFGMARQTLKRPQLMAIGCALAFAALPGTTVTQQAHAQQRIGEASSVRNQVMRVSAGRSLGLSSGGSVFRNETVRTGRNSSAKLVFLDSTNLAMGPQSSVVLDRFVYSGRTSGQALTVNLARGVFRFSTGVLDKRAYKIRTPLATIGVRGTVLGIMARRRVSRVTLVDDGAALVCARLFRGCIELKTRGDGVEITRTAIRRITSSVRKFTFEPICGSNPGLCTRTRLASTAPVSQPEAALCGR